MHSLSSLQSLDPDTKPGAFRLPPSPVLAWQVRDAVYVQALQSSSVLHHLLHSDQEGTFSFFFGIFIPNKYTTKSLPAYSIPFSGQVAERKEFQYNNEYSCVDTGNDRRELP